MSAEFDFGFRVGSIVDGLVFCSSSIGLISLRSTVLSRPGDMMFGDKNSI